jgi:hypothetical protein
MSVPSDVVCFHRKFEMDAVMRGFDPCQNDLQVIQLDLASEVQQEVLCHDLLFAS